MNLSRLKRTCDGLYYKCCLLRCAGALGEPREAAHGRDSVPVSVLSESLHTQGPPSEPRPAAHRGVSAQVFLLHQELHEERTPHEPHATTHRCVSSP